MARRKNKLLRWEIIFAVIVVSAFLFYKYGIHSVFEDYTGVVNAELSYDTSKKLSERQFDALVKQIVKKERFDQAWETTKSEKDTFTRKVKIGMLMNTPSFMNATKYKHLKYFKDAGIRQYKGPETCLTCHETMTVHHPDGSTETVNTMDDVVNSIHFTFQSSNPGFTTYGFDGRLVNAKDGKKIPVGKIDRACGIPGSFSWTGWASIIKSKPEHLDGKIELRSEGCGGCHVGGNYHPATEMMMPGGEVPDETKQGIDCLICHSQTYDMNYKYVIKDKYGYRWNQDRTLRAALTVTKPTDYNCLTCHQHDLGGDVYKFNNVAKHLGYEHKRILHAGTKRGTGWSAHDDVHKKAGLVCTDCHVPEGHKIPRGKKGVDLISNDLPGKAVACENCHTSAPHTKTVQKAILNGHVDHIACETCHITRIQKENVVLRDWVHPTWNAEEGMYIPTDIYWSGEANKGFTYLWFNGNGTFLANALGDNPKYPKRYDPFNQQIAVIDNPEVVAEIRKNVEKLKEHYPDIDVDNYVYTATHPLSQLPEKWRKKRQEVLDKTLRPLMEMGKSKIYPFKLFNAYMYEDMGNRGPFGAMILPFDYPTYYETGNSAHSVIAAVKNPMIKRMYEYPFKKYMMDEFMFYFGVKEWNTTYPLANGKLRNVEPKWMRQMGTLMLNHGTTAEARTCSDCHVPNGILNFEQLGYPPERVKELTNLPELKYFK